MIKKSYKKIFKNKGFSLIETLFYLSVFTVVSLAAINAMISLANVLRVSTVNNELVEGGFVLETISKIASTSVGGGVVDDELILTKDTGEEYKFVFSDNDVLMYKDDVLVGKLNPIHITINSFDVTVLSTPNGKALKTSISFNHKNNVAKVENLHNTVLLQGVY